MRASFQRERERERERERNYVRDVNYKMTIMMMGAELFSVLIQNKYFAYLYINKAEQI